MLVSVKVVSGWLVPPYKRNNCVFFLVVIEHALEDISDLTFGDICMLNVFF